MSPKPLGRSRYPTCWVLLITCLCAQKSEGASNPPSPWLNRKDVIKTMPLPYQKLILQETETNRNQQNVQLTNDVPQQLNAVASQVLNFLCRDVGPDSATCFWFPPAVDNGQLLGYEIDYREVSKSNTHTVVIANKKAEAFTLANLKTDTDYVISIYAMNRNGRGVKTTLNIRTKPPGTHFLLKTTPTPTSNGTPCPAGFTSSTGTAPGCKKCPDNQEPNAAKTSCQWCNYIPEFGFKCDQLVRAPLA